MLEGIEMMFARDHHNRHDHIHYNFRLADVAFREEEFFRLCCEAEGHMYVPMNDNKPWPTHAELTKKRLVAYKEIPVAHRLCITTQAGPMARKLLCIQAWKKKSLCMRVFFQKINKRQKKKTTTRTSFSFLVSFS